MWVWCLTEQLWLFLIAAMCLISVLLLSTLILTLFFRFAFRVFYQFPRKYTLLRSLFFFSIYSQVTLVLKNLLANAGDASDASLIPGFGKISWGRIWQPSPVFLPGKFHGWRSLVGYRPWGCKRITHHWVHTVRFDYIFQQSTYDCMWKLIITVN